MRPERACECVKCRLWPAGFRMLSYTSWRRHNGTENQRGVELAPGQALRAASQETVRSISALPPDNFDDFSDAQGGYDGGFDDYRDGSEASTILRDDVEQDRWDEESEDDILDYAEEHDHNMEVGPDGRPYVDIADLNKHHELHPAVRNAYTAIAFAKLTGMSDRHADKMLEQLAVTAQLAVESVEEEMHDDMSQSGNDSLHEARHIIEGLGDGDRTGNWRTAMSRLGVLSDNYIKRYICCPSCWWLTSYDKLHTVPSSTCGAPLGDDRFCDADIFSELNGLRTPIRVVPYTPLSTWIALWMQDPDFYSSIQHWRGHEDDSGERPPTDINEPYFHPDDRLHGLTDGSAWRASKGGVERNVYADDYEVVDEPLPDHTHEHVYRFVNLKHGLQIVIGCDWFRVKNMPGYSVGAVFASVANLPRSMMFKKKYTALLCVIPGPEEPSLTYLNRILEPVVEDFQKCEQGIWVKTENDGGYENVAARLLLTAADLPATKKIIGAVSHAHGIHPCHHCGIQAADLSSPESYKWRELPAKRSSPGGLLSDAFRHEDTTRSIEAKAIEMESGVRFSILNKLIGMEHSATAPVDHLHNLYLGLIKSFVNIIVENELFEGEIDGKSRLAVFAGVFHNAQYPGHLGRLPNRVTKQMLGGKAAGLKGDQWKRIGDMLVHALALSWRKEGTWEIDDVDLDEGLEAMEEDDVASIRGTPVPEPTRGTPGPGAGGRKPRKKPRRSREAAMPFRRNRKLWFQAAVSLTTGVRTLDTHSISLRDAESATDDIANAACTMISLGASLTINWHIAMHYPQHVKLFGPIAGYSAWAYERNNGTLSKVKHNMKERDIPMTLMRAWVRDGRLAALLNNPARNASPTEKAAIMMLLADKEALKGTVMLAEAFRALATARLPKPLKVSPVDLRKYPLAYSSLLTFVQETFPEYNFVGRLNAHDPRPCLPATSERYSLYSHVVYQGFKFCSALYNRTVRDQYALAAYKEDGSREVVRIRLFLHGTLVVQGKPSIDLELALVDTFDRAERPVPWSYRNIDLGYRLYQMTDISGEPLLHTRYIPISTLQASVVTSRFKMEGLDYMVAMSCDREGPEPEFWLGSDDPQTDALGMPDDDEDAEGETDYDD